MLLLSRETALGMVGVPSLTVYGHVPKKTSGPSWGSGFTPAGPHITQVIFACKPAGLTTDEVVRGLAAEAE